jgi:hypothetical protein
LCLSTWDPGENSIQSPIPVKWFSVGSNRNACVAFSWALPGRNNDVNVLSPVARLEAKLGKLSCFIVALKSPMRRWLIPRLVAIERLERGCRLACSCDC